MIEVSVTRVSRSLALSLGEDYGVRPFYALPLSRLDRRSAIELCERAASMYSDAEKRGLYIRRSIRSAVGRR